MMSCTPLSPRSTRWRRNADQPDLSLAPRRSPECPKTFGIDGAGHQQRDVAHLAGPSALHYDAVQIKIRMLASSSAKTSILVKMFLLRLDTVLGYARHTTALRDVLHASHRDARQIISISASSTELSGGGVRYEMIRGLKVWRRSLEP